jgi:hypothetical protein
MLIFWGGNILKCDEICEMGNSLEGIGERGRQQIKSVLFRYGGTGASAVFKIFQNCSSL